MEKACGANRYHYNPKLRDYARKLRKRMTQAEVYIWAFLLTSSKFRGYGFYRQRPVLRYIADFMCTRLLLIIEIDGGYHKRPDVAIRDAKRTEDLEAVGFTVLRFTNEEVIHSMKTVAKRLEAWMIDFENRNK